MKVIITILIGLCSYGLSAQQPELVTDYNVGETSSFTRFNYKGITLNNRIILPIVDEDLGEELGVIQNGTLTLLKDLAIGSNSSYPKSFTSFNGEVFFTALDDNRKSAIWTTDGTPQNTTLFAQFPNGSSGGSVEFITSSSGYLYYSIGGTLYKTDGVNIVEIGSDVHLGTIVDYRTTNYTRYNDEIAFMSVNEDEGKFRLYAVENDAIVMLTELDWPSINGNKYALTSVADGLIFSVSELFNYDLEQTYFYSTSTGELTELSLNGAYADRIFSFNDEYSLAWFFGQGVYSLDGTDQGIEQIFTTIENGLGYSVDVPHLVYNDKVLFLTGQGVFDDPSVVYSDGTAAGTRLLFENDSQVSNMILSGPYAIIADDTQGGNLPALYSIDMRDGTYSNFYNFKENALVPQAILLLGVINDKLYFQSELDSSVGRELYSIEVDFVTNVDYLKEADFDVMITNNGYIVNTDKYSDVQVTIYSLDGKMITTHTRATNVYHDLSNLNGMYVLEIQSKLARSTHKFISID